MTAVPAAGAAMSWIAVVWMAILGGLATPPGLPPLPEAPVLAKIAPEQCLAYFAMSGIAVPNSKSSSQTEQLLAEPEVQALRARFAQAIRASINQQLPSGMLPSGASPNDLADLLTIVMTRPLAVYVASVEPQPAAPQIRGGLAIHLGDKLPEAKAKVEKLSKALPPQLVQHTTIDGVQWMTLQTPFGPVVCGFRGKYFVAAIGPGELEALIDRAKGNVPAWLTQLRQQSAVERVSTIAYLNLKAILTLALPMAGPQAAKLASDSGFANVASVSSIMGLEKAGCVTRTVLAIEGQPQGLLRFAAVKPLAAADLAAIPADSTVAIAVKINPASVLDACTEMAAKADPKAHAAMLQNIAQMEAQVGLKLREDVLQPLGDTLVLYGSMGQMGLPSAVVSLQIKDSQQAAKTYAKLMQLAEAMLGRDNPLGIKLMKNKVDAKDACTIQFSRPGVPPISWCLTEKELVVGITPQRLQSHFAPPMGFKPLNQSPHVAVALSGGAEPVSLLYCNLPQLFDAFYPMFPMAAGMMQQRGLQLDAASPPSANAIRPHLAPLVSVVQKAPAGIEFIEHYSLPGVNLTSSAPLTLALLLPAVQAGREAARRAQSVNNMKQLALSMFVYENAKKSFPPAYKADGSGKPLLSWRVLVLPYLDQDALYKEFRLDEPWDSEHNKKLIARMPAAFRDPNSHIAASEGKTNYLTVPRPAFPGDKGVGVAEIRDGTSNTIMLVEVPDEQGVIWTRPDDFQYDERNPAKGLIGMRPGGFLAAFCDGSVHLLSETIDPNTMKLLFMRDDGQPIDTTRFLR